MLESLVAKNLDLKSSEPRRFIVSVSGGLDSTVLLSVLHKLSQSFPLKLSLFHMNFQLRGKESNEDEAFVRELSKKFGIPIHAKRVKISKSSGVQEKARSARLQELKALPDGDLIEAHHGDDQIETFLFRLFRGAGLHGLSAMAEKSFREGRWVFRPLLTVTKEELRKYAKIRGLTHREDSSNKTLLYDRNWMRHELLPLIVKKFPKAKMAILRAIEEIQEEVQKFSAETIPDDQVAPDGGWKWDQLHALSKPELQRWIHREFQKKWGTFLSRKQIVELAEKILKGEAFSFNAPKNLVIRGRPRSRTVLEPKILLEYAASRR